MDTKAAQVDLESRGFTICLARLKTEKMIVEEVPAIKMKGQNESG